VEAAKICDEIPSVKRALHHYAESVSAGHGDEQVVHLLSEMAQTEQDPQCKDALTTLVEQENAAVDCSVRLMGAKESKDEEATKVNAKVAIENYLIDLRLGKIKNPMKDVCQKVKCAAEKGESNAALDILERSLAQNPAHTANLDKVRARCGHVVKKGTLMNALRNPEGKREWVELFNESLNEPHKSKGCWGSVMKYVHSLERDTCRHRYACVFGDGVVGHLKDTEIVERAQHKTADQLGQESCFMTDEQARRLADVREGESIYTNDGQLRAKKIEHEPAKPVIPLPDAAPALSTAGALPSRHVERRAAKDALRAGPSIRPKTVVSSLPSEPRRRSTP
jgi:hypothetical protein